MSNPDKNSNYADLISRYLSGEASDAEVQQLESWVLAAEENRATFVSAKKAWVLTGMEKDVTNVDVEKAWKQTQSSLGNQGKVVPLKQRRRLWIGIAASVAILIVAGLGIIWNGSRNAWKEVVADRTALFANLPDGTEVNLSPGSRIRYKFGTKPAERRVVLEGGAFFNVEREVDRPFIIEAKEIEVEVLGTSFYVDARNDEPEIQVMVESGQVRVQAAGQQEDLEAEDKVIFRKATNELLAEKNEDQNFRSVVTNDLIFDNSPLEEVLFVLKRHFGVNIVANIADTSNCEIGATYEDQSLNAILLILETTWGIEVIRQDGQIQLTGAGCQ